MSYPLSGSPGQGPAYGGMPGPPAPQNLGALAEDSGKKKAAKKTTRKVVNRNLIIALIIAAMVGVAFLFFATSPAQGQWAVVAKQDIAPLTPMDISLVEAAFLPQEAIADGTFVGGTAEEALALATTTFEAKPRTKFLVSRGMQLAPTFFGADLSLDQPLNPGERLLSVSATVVNGVSGKIKPGDHVDIIGTAQTPSGPVTGNLVQNVEVVAVSAPEDAYRQAASEQQKTPVEGSTTTSGNYLPADPIAPGIYLVRVPEALAVSLVAVQNNGTITLVFRDPNSPDQSVAAVTAGEAICNSNPDSPACAGTATSPLG